jgi:phage FluMu protein Com
MYENNSISKGIYIKCKKCKEIVEIVVNEPMSHDIQRKEAKKDGRWQNSNRN